LVLKEVFNIRERHKRIGGRKLYKLLEPFMLEHQIKMGRDALFNLLSDNNLLVKRRKKTAKTTNSYHWFHRYPNKIKDLVATRSNHLWVSDITYWKTAFGFIYISLITDAYSRKIVGYNVGLTLEAIECLQALKMALKSLSHVSDGLIHHSDRGLQYCSCQYVKLLEDNNIEISMTENSDPLENAIAERINGILKDEYLECYQVENIEHAKQLLDSVVRLYNQERPHMSIGNLTPEVVHSSEIKTEKLWKNYYVKKERKEAEILSH
jgi:transposase InsO family protein